MTVKVLVTSLGQHIIADAKQVENKESQELVGYWLDKPRLVGYNRDEESGDIGIQYLPYCLISDEQSFTLRADHVVAILEPRDDVASRYDEVVNPPEQETTVELNDESSDIPAEDGTDADSVD